MNYLRAIVAAAALTGLSGCEGTGVDFPNSPDLITFLAVGAGSISGSEAVSVIDDLNALTAPGNANDVSTDIPSSASATYNGVVAFDLDTNSSIMGRISMISNFTAGSLAGSAGDFTIFDESGSDPVPVEVLSGALPITSGTVTTVVSGAPTTLAATMNGNLTASAGIYGVTSSLTGTFLKVKGQNIVGGFMDGTLSKPDATNQTIAGRMIAAE